MLGAAFSAKGGMTQIGKSQDLPRMNADQHGSERRAKTQLPAKAAGLDKKLRARSQRPGASSLEANSLLYRCHAGAEAGLVAGAGVLVDHALSHSLVDQGDGVAEGRPGRRGIARLDGLAQLAQRGPGLRGVGAVGLRAFGGLAGALQRRKMICHWL